MGKCILVRTEKEKRLFLSLPKKLYQRKECTQDIEAEKSLLNGTHPLSKQVEIYPYIYVNHNKVVCRCVMTYYKEDDNAYIGFFESLDDFACASAMIKTVSKKAKADGKAALVGPYDVSFWIRYRFKCDHFDSVYTCEPYNKCYYPQMWERMGFQVTDRYYSNQIRVPRKSDQSEKYKLRLQRFLQNGYIIKSPAESNFLQCLEEIYELLTKLYRSFPGYKEITKKQFMELYTPLKKILDYSMVKLVYKDEKLVAFFVSIPNYGNAIYHLDFWNLLKILRIKRKPKEYVLLYMGVDEKHLGIGSALSQLIKEELQEKQATSIGALIHEGKVSGNYYRALYTDQYQYVLYRKDL